MNGRRFIRGIPVSQIRKREDHPWVISLASNLGRDPEKCKHKTLERGIAVWAEEGLRQKYGVPPGDRALVFLPNQEGSWAACSLCGALRNERGEWITLFDTRRVEENV